MSESIVIVKPRAYSVGRIVKIETLPGGSTSTTVIAKPKKKRVSKRYRKADKTLRRLAEAQRTAASDFLDRHERSGGKKKNGALRKAPKNLMKASRKGLKKLKLF